MKRKSAKTFQRFLLLATFLGFFAFGALSARAQTNSCAAFYTMAAGAYNVQTNYWNQGTCPGSQCLNISGNGDFTVTGNFNCAPTVATYPSIYYGCHYGNCTAGTNLPMQVSSLNCVTSSWSFSPTNSGSWDAAYDIFLTPSSNTSNGPTGGAEIMIWLDYMGNVPPAGSQVGTVSIDGMSFTLWEGNIGWNYIAYLANSKTTSVSNLNILNFIKDSVSRGYVQNSWYLDVIEAGNEFRTGGLPFTSSGFSASVNNGCSGGGGNPP
ncbi:MAG TPA: hypothetical protein VJ873_08625, partial [bacterium]|nr:hypothetical protein [bacterium]